MSKLLRNLFGWDYLDVDRLHELSQFADDLGVGENVVEEVKHRGLDVTSINSYSYVLICRIFDELCERAAAEGVDGYIIDRAREEAEIYANYLEVSTGFDSIDGYDPEQPTAEIVENFVKELREKYAD